MEVDGQREIISSMLMNPKHTENIYITHILFDLLSSDSVNNGSRSGEQIFQSLHWSQQKILADGKSKADSITNDLLKFTEETVPFEKRIILMKTPNSVKEINNSKGGEGTAKAQQYIEGLLKIPFGIYKKESIIDFISEFKIQVNSLFGTLKNNVVKLIPDHNIPLIDSTELSGLKSSSDIDIFLKGLENYYRIKSNQILPTLLKTLPNNNLKQILSNLSLAKSGKKTQLVERLLNHQTSITLQTRIQYNLLPAKLLQQDSKETIHQFQNLQKKWQEYKSDRSSFLQRVDDTLDSAVYGMDDAKVEIRRIIGQWINGSNEGYILGFEGPPGTGKTTLAKKGIARCLRDADSKERPFTFIALGGSTNGSTLEGHNYTYVGSTWGRIVDALIEAQCMNPIIYIDELDKISKTEHGKELIGILIHLTDPSQNEEFMDKYFSGIKLDISNCLIIFSYNDVTQVDRVLLDRIHRIKIKGLNRHDKFKVAKKHLIPEICKTVGIRTEDIVIDEETLFFLIDNYTYEAGARRLKECLFDIIREINLQFLTGTITQFPQTITIPLIKEIFSSQKRVQIKRIPNKPAVGLINGLYATAAGVGGITVIESFRYLSESRLSLELTGQQGDVMKESMRVSKTVAWNLLPCTIKERIRKDSPFGIHVHCPEAAQPKDGPSAGVAITVSILSLLSKIPINNKIAVTGEIDLNGNILAIGGLESKIEGAKSAGVKLVLCPEENREDLQKIRDSEHPPEKDGEFEVQMVSNIYQAIDILLLGGEKCSSLFHKYSTLNLSHNDYLLTFKSMCDESKDLICILDTTNAFNLLYCSKGFPSIGWDVKEMYGKSIFNYIHSSYIESLRKTLQNTKEGDTESCIRLRITKDGGESFVVICNTKKIDNIISCTLTLVEQSNSENISN
jgi:endopeptidase La